MATYSDFVRDGYQRPIPGATAKLFTADGTTQVAMATTGLDGRFSLEVADGKYLLEVSFGGVSDRSSVIVGNPPEYVGPTGPANSTYITLTALKAAPSTNASYILATASGPINYAYVTGNFTGKADDVNVVALNGTPLATGALVRQSSASIQTSAGRSLQRRIDDIAGLADKLEINDFDDVKAAAQMAFTLANPSQGRGVTLRAPRKVMFLYEPLVVPTLTTIVGGGYRDTFFIPQFDGPMFIFDSVVLSGLRNARLGLGSGKNVCGIDIRTSTADARALNFGDLEIVGGGAAGAKSGNDGGQTAIRAFTTGGRIITECAFDRLIMSEIDRPVIMNGPEGNEFTRFVIDQYGYSGQCGMELVTHADYYQGRLAGAPAAGTVAYKQGGFRSQAILRVDCGNGTLAVDLAQNSGNQVMLQRPFELGPPTVQTPIGNVRPGNTLIDSFRTFALGPAPSTANFILAGFGDGAFVDGITGDDRSIRFTVHAGTANYGAPNVGYSFAGGVWPFANAIVTVSRNGGNQPAAVNFGASASVNGWGFQSTLVPANGEAYVFQVGVS